MAILDELEAYPSLYDRQQIEIQKCSDSSIVLAWIYLLKKWKSDLLETSSEMMENYSSLGEHGRPYVDRYVRAIEMLEDDLGSNIYREILGDSEDLDNFLAQKKANFDLKTSK
ncbi:unnamed protein product [Caenorhabditis angaria]|uniref:Gamma-glutamylcyclotransferase family protein n=1 Tax=Caenorhabditis angaria TaxID=860376 RepID=A0A9P1IP32_9PELO|nr:unnamed protein product [Caenorhabditis angaria]